MFKQYSDTAPPPYSESSRMIDRPPSPSLLTSHLATYLAGLSARLRETQSARATHHALADLDLVERIVPHVESFVADVASHSDINSHKYNLSFSLLSSSSSSSSPPSHPQPPAELTIVPASAVPPIWALTGATERRREGELVHLVRLPVLGPQPSPFPAPQLDGDKGRPTGAPLLLRNSKGSEVVVGEGDCEGDGSAALPSAGPSLRPARDWTWSQFDEWGRWDEDAEAAAAGRSTAASSLSSLWWQDELMAQRLAAYLQPRAAVWTDWGEIQAAGVQQAKPDKKTGWGLWRKKSSSSPVTPSSLSAQGLPMATAVSPVSPNLEQHDSVTMTVRAEEVTFRRENDLGLWESMTGWGIVVRITVR